MSVATDIIDHLAAVGEGSVGGTSRWSLNAAREPARPDGTVTVYDLEGWGTADPDNALHHPAVQVRVRDHDYRTAYDKAIAIRDALTVLGGFTVGANRYVGGWALSEPSSLGYDEEDRARVVLNVNLLKQE